MKRIILLFTVFYLCFSITGIASALSSEDANSLDTDSLYYSPSSSASTCSSGGVGLPILTGSDNGQKIWNYFLGQGFSTNQTAAILGNLYGQDGTFNPEQVEGGGSSPTPTTTQDVGWGLAQWTPTGGNPNPVIAAAKDAGVSSSDIDTLSGQLVVILYQMNHGGNTGSFVMSDFKQNSDINSASDYFYKYFEGGGAAAYQTEEGYSQKMLTYYGGNSSPAGGGQVASSNGCNVSVSCSNGNASNSSLSPIRQNVVCIAEQQLSLWESQPGYPHPSYSQSGYLVYSQNRSEEWCADFASWVYNQAGDPFSKTDWDFPGVNGIYNLGVSGGSGFTWHPESSNYTPVPGDLAIHSTSGNPYYHVNIYISSSGGTATYIGGDQGDGPYPGGSIVSYEYGSGYYDNDIIGYVSPD